MSDAAAKELPFLNDAEIADLCAGLQLPAAQCRYLAKLGLLVSRKPNGRPIVARSEFERVLGAGRFVGKAQNDSTASPNVASLMDHLSKRKPNGKTAQRR